MADQKRLKNNTVKSSYDSLPRTIQNKMLRIRSIIYEQAAMNGVVGEIEESLKWGQPSYVSKNKVGTPIRLGVEKKSPGTIGVYVSCSTSLIETVKHIYGDTFRYDGNRGILIVTTGELPEDALRHIVDLALTYHST